MAMVLSFSGEDNKARKSSFRSGEKKPWMLKDYLRDDVGSCSSNNGFRSFPRRQCCVAVRNIIEKEVTRNHSRHHRRRHSSKHMLSRSDCSFSYAVQRASMAVINAVKLIPFNTPVKSDGGKRFLSRSFSKKLFSKRSFFWKKDKKSNSNRRRCDEDQFDDEIEGWISSGVVGKEKYKPLDFSNDTTVTNVSTTSISNSDGKSDGSWSDITFTSDSSENDDVERGEKMEVSKIVGVLASEDFVEPAIKEEMLWFDEEAEIMQQTSPISVLDLLHNYDGGSSPITPRSAQSKRTKERLMKKLGRFECLAELEPVNLESLLLSPEIIQDQSPECCIQPCSTPSFILSTTQSEDEEELEEEEEQSHENEDEKHTKYLLNITRRNSTPNKAYKFELENVLLDYFRENVTQKESHTLLKAAEDWLNGYYDNLILGWEVKDKRQAYIRDMEEGGWWPKDTKLERDEVGAKLGDEVLAHLIEEIMVEL